MSRDSRLIPALLSEVKINAVCEMEASKNTAHGTMALKQCERPFRKATRRHEGAAGENEQPTEQFDAAMHEKSGGVKRAAIKQHPECRQRPCLQEIPTRAGQPQQSGNRTNEKRRQQSLRHAPRGRRPEWFCFL